MHVDVAVIGRGMIGSAAARHLAEGGLEVALVGPDEAPERTSWPGPFSSHPDEGRITRIAGRTELWTEVAARSVARYPDIEARSGIGFHTPCGVVAVFADAAGWVERGRARGSDIREVDADWVRDHFGIHLPSDASMAFEGAPAGRINPRRLVTAQTRLAEQAGAEIVVDTATARTRTPSGFRIELRGGSTLSASRLLLATGAFGADLLEVPLDLERRPRTTLMAEMADPGGLPSLLSDRPADDRVEEIYWVPPVRYPDGRVMIKIGGNLWEFDPLTPDELVEWFHGDGSALEVEVLENNLRALLPTTDFASFERAPCVITGTPTGHPYVGWVDEGVAVALAGNGSAAKSSDEWGRLAATLFTDDGWDESIDPTLVAPRIVG